MFLRRFARLAKFDFDRWAYGINWPQDPKVLPLMHDVRIVAEDIKFAFNCWCLLRLGCFYGTAHPTILSKLDNTTPSMARDLRGNYMFHDNAKVGGCLSPDYLKIALTPSHPNAVPLHHYDFSAAVRAHNKRGIELVVGQENGLSRATIDQCDGCVYLPQFGSMGSLSMLNALGIALHHVHALNRAPPRESIVDQMMKTEYGSQPITETKEEQAENNSAKSVPHNDDLTDMSNEQLHGLLAARREHYKLQLGVLWQNDISDRNLGATIRNANVYNCEKVVVLNRKKFSRRGTVGSHHYTPMIFKKNIDAAIESGELEGYELWLLHSYYPQHVNHYLTIDDTETEKQVAKVRELLTKKPAVWMKPVDYDLYAPVCDAGLKRYVTSRQEVSPNHPIYGRFYSGEPQYLDMETKLGGRAERTAPPVTMCDDLEGMKDAVQTTMKKGKKGIMLVVPEDCCTPRWELLRRCDRVMMLVGPDRCQQAVQRGLPPAIASAVAMDRLRLAIEMASS